MNIIKLKTRLRRIGYMLRERGLRFTSKYLFMASTYNNDVIREIFLIKLYPWFVFYPRYIEVEVTTRCDLRCTMCEHTYWKEKGVDMTFEQFKRVIDQFPKLAWIGTTGIGSSFLNKDYLKMLEYAKSKSIYTELFDPFHRMNSEIIENIVKNKLIDRLICSIDGATPETYEKIRVGAKFEKVINNVKELVRMKKAWKTSFPELSFHFIISKDNYLEVPIFIDLVNEITEGNNIGIMFSHLLHTFDEIKDMVFELPKDIRAEAVRKTREYGIKLIWGKSAREEKPPLKKCTEWTMPFVFVDGSVIPCCAGNEANRREFQIKYRMGNIYEESFEKIWQGNVKKLRDAINEGQCPPICADCPAYDTR